MASNPNPISIALPTNTPQNVILLANPASTGANNTQLGKISFQGYNSTGVLNESAYISISSGQTFNAASGYGSTVSIFVTASGATGTPNTGITIDTRNNVLLNAGCIAAYNVGWKNRIMNGDMRIAQRGTSFVVGASGSGNTYYLMDRFCLVNNITTGGITMSQGTLTNSDTPWAYGFRNFWNMTVSTANTNYSWISPAQPIESTFMADLQWGTSQGQPMTISFWAKVAQNATTIAVGIRNYTQTYTYNSTVTLTTGGAWQYCTVTVPAPPVAANIWDPTPNKYFYITIGVYQASSMAPAANTWYNANYLGVTGITNFWATLNNYLYLTGVQVEKGTVATPFEFRNYAQEMTACQRYYEKSYDYGTAPGTANVWLGMKTSYASNTSTLGSQQFAVEKRAAPTTITLYNYGGTSGATSSWAGVATVSGCSASRISTKGFFVQSSAGFTTNTSYMYQYVAIADF